MPLFAVTGENLAESDLTSTPGHHVEGKCGWDIWGKVTRTSAKSASSAWRPFDMSFDEAIPAG